MRYFLKFFLPISLLWPAIAIASVSDCLDISLNPVPLITQIFSVANLIGYATCISVLMLLALYKFLRLQKIPQKHSIAYVIAAPLLYFLVRWEIKHLFPYFDFGKNHSCSAYFTVDERIIYGGLFGLFFLIGTYIYLLGVKLEGKKFEIYQNSFFAALILFACITGVRFHSYLWRAMELGSQ